MLLTCSDGLPCGPRRNFLCRPIPSVDSPPPTPPPAPPYPAILGIIRSEIANLGAAQSNTAGLEELHRNLLTEQQKSHTVLLEQVNMKFDEKKNEIAESTQKELKVIESQIHSLQVWRAGGGRFLWLPPPPKITRPLHLQQHIVALRGAKTQSRCTGGSCTSPRAPRASDPCLDWQTEGRAAQGKGV